jgi:hypothetical protein
MDGEVANADVAARLRQAADLLEQQGAGHFRVQAYRNAAESIETLPESVSTLLEREGIAGLRELPGIGGSLSAAIREIVQTGRWSQLDRLRGETDAEKLFRTIPGVGEKLARGLHDELHVDTLEDLEAAAYDGRLARVPGMGPRRVAALRASLSAMLSRVRGRFPRSSPPGVVGTAPGAVPGAAPGAAAVPLHEPSVAVLLDVDREYRDRAARGDLRTIAPKRFNPTHAAWLPVMHTGRGDWHFTVLFSNTALAHQLGRTNDWVVIYFEDGDHRERQRTVVTETRGAQAGQRVVRGREHEPPE